MATAGIVVRPEGTPVPGVGSGSISSEHKEMVNQAVVHIDAKGTRGSGFVAELRVRRDTKVVLMTCNHVLPSREAAKNSSIYFGRISEDEPGTKIEGQELFDDDFFVTDNHEIRDWKRMFDYTVVEMKRAVLHTYLKDNVPKPLSLTTCAEMKDEDLSVGNTVYIVHYPKISETYDRHENAEQISIIQGPYIGHMAESFPGSSGSPVLREYNNELVVVGLHRGDLGSQGHTLINFATLITVILDDIRMVDYDDSKFPEVGPFATEARECAMELKKQARKQTASSVETAPSNSRDDSQDPMNEWNSNALLALTEQLKLKVIVKTGLIDKLPKAAGGFMSLMEAHAVQSKPDNAQQMGELIQILLGKTNADFGTFCKMLRQSSYDVWANQLEKKTREFKIKST